ncbi:MAG: sulfotransferase [Xanthomonadales bacterium]|nr:sulfotransferase [Xanthomonadales bacterium]
MSSIRVPTGLCFQTRFFAATRGIWKRLADLESSVVRQETGQLNVDRPVYIASLPRSGTTILTEMLAQHPDLTCHRYSDFPNVWTPYWRNYLLKKARVHPPKMQLRAHQDRIEVSNESPEAVEEVLWMNFFSSLHDATVSQVMDGQLRSGEFDRFYKEHIRKLLAVRSASRYLAKGNYNVSRIRYILALYPDAKFLVPVRDPVHQVASLARQHALFTRASREDPRIPLQMAMSGHYEFGPQRVPVNFGNLEATRVITDCWQQGREAEGWARYWAETYQHIVGQLEAFPEVRKACLMFRYEDLCTHSPRLIDTILAHCELPEYGFETVRAEYISRLSPPDYYEVDFSPHDLRQITRHCGAVNEKLSKFCQNP